MITGDQLVAHAIGDYILQSDWMATEKTKKNLAAGAHALTYAIPFIYLGPSLAGFLFIIFTHFIIDRWRLARYVCWFKNFAAPVTYHYRWDDCQATGYHKDKPAAMTVWLMIICDNTMHVLCNGIALAWLT